MTRLPPKNSSVESNKYQIPEFVDSLNEPQHRQLRAMVYSAYASGWLDAMRRASEDLKCSEATCLLDTQNALAETIIRDWEDSHARWILHVFPWEGDE